MHSKEADGCRLCRYRRVQEKRPDRDCLNGEVTVYLTLTFVLFVSLILALVESASVQMAKNYRRADMNRALECVFAEYQKELLENYDVFAIECGYETGTYTEQNILDRLSYYGADMENEIERIQLFTDNSGELFRDQVGKYMKHKYGIAWADKYLGNVSLWKNQEEKADEFTEEEEKQNDQLKDLLGEQEAELPEEENPMQHVAELKRSPILELVLPKDKTISEKQISLQEMPEKRKETMIDELLEERREKTSYYDTREHDWISEQEMGSSIMRETDNLWMPVKRFLNKHKKSKWGDWDGLHIEEEEL